MAVHEKEMEMPRTRDARLEARLSPDDFDTISHAAAAQGLSRTAFVVQAAMDAAHKLLRDQQLTTIAVAHGQSFMEWLDRPAEVLPNMKPLVDAPVLPHR
jgi:uncharacterized protein (DUF1778 family)